MDETVVRCMEWMRRLIGRPRIHLGGLEQCTRELERHLDGIVESGDDAKARIAKATLNRYQAVIEAAESRAGFMTRGVQVSVYGLDRMLGIAGEEPVAATVFLRKANWSQPRTITGKLARLLELDTQEASRSAAAIYSGTSIYLVEAKPSVIELSRWDDENSVLVSASGGNASEEMNFARSQDLLYINGAAPHFEELSRLDGAVVTLAP